jgi:multicomponent K+:H+ antiporter subunit A
MLLVWILILPFAGSLCAAFLPSNARNAEAWLAGLVALACAVLTATLYPQIATGTVVRMGVPWVPTLGLELSLRMDGYAWLFAMLITVMGALVVLYARYYMSPQDPVPRFFSFFLAFMGAMLGVVLSGNLIQLVFFWELTSLSSFMLIAYWHHRIDARRGARMALIVTTAGGLCLLAGVLMLGHIVGSYDLDVVLAAGDRIRAHGWYLAVLILIVLGALTKSAQFPFHFWLPHAMAAPTPVSAYLHSATMVKAGVFLLVRLWPILAGTESWFWIVGGAGLCSLVFGAYAATFQQDMKGVLAYSTISHLGLITLLLGLNSELALVAAIFHIVNHATFKASLFMAAGMVDHETGTRDLTRLSGLYRVMPITATLAVVAAASMAGVPLLNGFISKEMFFAETVFVSGNWIMRFGLPIVAVIYGVFSVAYSLRFILQVFFGPRPHDLPRTPHEPPGWMLVPSGLLVMACLVVGILPSLTVGPLLDLAAASVLGASLPTYSLVVWHGLTLPLMMSLLALGGGIVLYLMLGKYQQRAPGVVPIIYPVNGKRLFELVLDNVTRGGTALNQLLTSERLQVQLLLLVGVAFAAACIPLWQDGLPEGDMALTSVDPVFALLWLGGAACALGAALNAKYHRLAALALTGTTGLITMLTFAWFSAPDLALTQLAVEVVTVVLILLGLRWLPPRFRDDDEKSIPLRQRVRARGRRLRDLLLAAVVGGGMAALTYAVLTRRAGAGISPFFVENSLSLGGGSNVINVILVDFRGFDTFGEITVLGIVALTIYALLRRFRPAPESIGITSQQRIQDGPRAGADPNPQAVLTPGQMALPAVLVRLLLPIALIASIFFLLRGHDAPGGGFVGGLVMATAVILQYMAGGTVWAESRTRIHPQYWIGLGLLCAAGAGVLAWLAGSPFLSALVWDLTLPLIGKIHLSSVLLFDFGVYLLVVGATVLILVALAHQSLRSHRQQGAVHSVPVPAVVRVTKRAAPRSMEN